MKCKKCKTKVNNYYKDINKPGWEILTFWRCKCGKTTKVSSYIKKIEDYSVID